MSAARVVVLLSGGLDSATVFAIARSRGFECHALSFDYGQRHAAELHAAGRIADTLGAASHRTMGIGLDAFGGSALTDTSLEVPEQGGDGIPVTYVPARNTVFLACALALAETLESTDLFIGVNAVDYSGYPDCRPAFIEAFERLAAQATRAGAEGARYRVHAPLMEMSKADIIREGTRLGVDYAMTVSCYRADDEGRACGRCDACRFRRRGFDDAGVPDPTIYA